MLNKIWPVFLIMSFAYGLCFGNIQEVSTAVFQSTESAVSLCIKLLGTICFWTGIMKIAEKTSIIKKLKKMLKPVIRLLFPNMKEEDKEYGEISMNMVANIMGLRKCSNSDGIEGNENFAGEK